MGHSDPWNCNIVHYCPGGGEILHELSQEIQPQAFRSLPDSAGHRSADILSLMEET